MQNTYWRNEDERHSPLEKYTSHFIRKGSKGLFKVLLWEWVGNRTELEYIDPHSAISVVSFSFTRAAQPEARGPTLCWILTSSTASCLQLLDHQTQSGDPRAPSAWWWLSLPHLVTNGSGLETNWLPVFTELCDSSIAHSISLEWHVWSSSSGNNCHAVHRSLSSSASVYDSTMGFYLVPYCQPNPPTRFLPITAIGMCHFLPVHHFGMASLAGSKVNIQYGELWQ